MDVTSSKGQVDHMSMSPGRHVDAAMHICSRDGSGSRVDFWAQVVVHTSLHVHNIGALASSV